MYMYVIVVTRLSIIEAISTVESYAVASWHVAPSVKKKLTKTPDYNEMSAHDRLMMDGKISLVITVISVHQHFCL